jgi:hypothetical protein
MLRVRPIHFTSNLNEWEELLTAIGMAKSVDEGSWKEFDAGAGRLALHTTDSAFAEAGATVFGVEVGDLAEFARRTNEAAGGPDADTATVISAERGDACRIRSGDGFTFLADKAEHGANCADADPALTVVEVWFTEKPEAAIETLHAIGARFRPVPDNDETADFTAKNGGVLMVRPGSGPAHAGLGFEYDGDLEALAGRLTAAGHEVRVTEEAYGRSLHVANPDTEAPAVWISQQAR